jgi:GNAT superfamily N-acetyltransferase
VADLHGKTIRERALALIHIAHPDHRESLMAEARKRSIVSSSQVAVLGVGAPELDAYESELVTSDGQKLQVRPIRPTDESMMRDLFYSFSEETVYFRFFHHMKSMPQESLQRFVSVDYAREMALVALHRSEGGERIVAVARYAMDPASRTADVAFVTRDDWQRKGIGVHMFAELIRIARQHGAEAFEARVLAGNDGMIRLFHKCALGPVQSDLQAGEYRLRFRVRSAGAASAAASGKAAATPPPDQAL